MDDYPELWQFLLDVQPTGRAVIRSKSAFAIGSGSEEKELEINEDGLICVGRMCTWPERRKHSDSDARQAMIEECSALLSLRHPNIIQYLGLCFLHDSDLPTVVMEYVPHSLQQLLQTVVDIPLPVKHSILGDVARGLSYLHSRSPPIVHGQVTASNVLLTFGMVAKITNIELSLHSQPTQPPVVVDKQVSPADDVNSFGNLMLYTILQEHPVPTTPPARNQGDHGVPEHNQLSPSEQLGLLLGSCTHPAVQLVEWCLQPEPEKHPSASQVLSELSEGWLEIECPSEVRKLGLMVSLKLLERQSEMNNGIESQPGTGSEVVCEEESDRSDMEASEPEFESVQHESVIDDGIVPSGTDSESLSEVEPTIEDEADALSNKSGVESEQDESPWIKTAPVQYDKARDTGLSDCKQGKTGFRGRVREASFTSSSSLNHYVLKRKGFREKATSSKSSHPKLRTPTHMGDKRFKCEECKAEFTHSSLLEQHKRVHVGEKQSQCKVCKARFTSRTKLKLHEMEHKGKKPFRCEVCGAEFSYGSQLKRHSLTHTGEKPFYCELCGVKFNQKSNLNKHKVIHTGERPFQCEICGARFNCRSYLKQHKLTHTGEKPFQCEICGARFNRRSHLKRHKLTHTGEKPFQCETCGAKFNRSTILKRHELTHIIGDQKDSSNVH